MLKEKNWRMCGQCLSSNCQLLQYLAKKNKTQPKFIGTCKGKSITLGEVPEALKDIEKKIDLNKNKKKSEKKKAANLNTAAVEPTANNYSNDPIQFIYSNQDLLSGDSSRQTEHDTVNFSSYAVKVSQLPDITESLLPVWEEMVDSKKHKCVICGKQKLNLEKYDDHMVFKHQISLQKPDLEEYEQARAFWKFDHEESTPEELETAYWDYDSDTGKRYSEGESEEEPNTDEALDYESPQFSSGNNSSSGSSSEESSRSYQKKKRRTKKMMKESPPMVPLDQYEKEKEELSNHLEEKIKNMEMNVKNVWSNNANLNPFSVVDSFTRQNRYAPVASLTLP